MSVRLDAIQTFGRGLKDWCRLTVPLICIARYLSDRPIDWLFFFIGWKFLRTSTSYFYRENNNPETFDLHDHTNRRKNNFRSQSHRSRSKDFALTRVTSSTEVSQILLTALPTIVLSNVSCYLHPRDVLDLDTVLRSGMGLQKNGISRNGITRHNYDCLVGDAIWKRIWYRDYGDILLQWKVSREAFRRSLARLSPESSEFSDDYDNTSNGHGDGCLEQKLSKRLEQIAEMAIPTTMKDFYFSFGECYVDYVLAGKNTIDECYMGLHGHIFDFTDFAEYHPGLIEPILKECGGDATYYFEDIPHSSAARNIARRLCVLVDHSVFDFDYDVDTSDSRCCGLELLIDDGSSKLKEVLRSSNTRPLSKDGYEQNRNRWMAHIVPRRPERRRHPTLERIRTRFQQELRQQKRHQFSLRNYQGHGTHVFESVSNSTFVSMTTDLISSCSPFWKQQDSLSRLYYDPLAQKWVRWCPENPATCLHSE